MLELLKNVFKLIQAIQAIYYNTSCTSCIMIHNYLLNVLEDVKQA